MQHARFLLSLIVFFCAFSQSLHAHNAPAIVCEQQILGSPRPVTLKTLRAAARERITRNSRLAPLPGFDDVEEQARYEQVGETPRLALQQMLGMSASLLSTPAPTSTDIAAASMIEGETSMPLHVDTVVNGKRRGTAVYTSVPESTYLEGGKFLIGSQHKTALVFLHGGGTPTASGKNAAFPLSDKMAALGIPVIAPDMPGHGRATKNPDGLLTFQEMADWLMQVIDKLVDPSVKIVLAGHSWGGEFAVFMHRLSADPRYARIVHYIALSPPVDTSVGQGAEKRLEHERWYEENYKTLKKRIAPSDFKFLNNILRHGKNSDIGSLFCHLTNLDYSTPPLTVEEQKKLKPITVVVGEADGLVYVGREKQFQEVFGNLVAPSRFILLGPGRTFESKKPEDVFPTGHGIFDVYIEGTTTPLVYNLIGEIAQGVEAQPAAPVTETDKNRALLKKFLFNETRYFAFREFIDQHAEFIESGTPHLREISDRKVALDEYLKAVDERREKSKKETDAKVAAAIQALRAKLSIEGNLTLEAAQRELATPELTEARKAELEAFVQRVEAIDEKLKIGFKDAQSEQELAKLQAEHAKLLAELEIASFDKHPEVLKSLQARKDLDKAMEAKRSALARMNQKYQEILKGKQSRFGKARDEQVRAANPPAGVDDLRSALRELRVDRSPERRAKLHSFVEMYGPTENKARYEAAASEAETLLSIKRPAGVTGPDDAEVKKAMVDSQMSYTYAPLRELQPLTERIAALNNEVGSAFSGEQNQQAIPKLATAVHNKTAKRNSLWKKLEELWAVTDEGTKLLTSPGYERAEENEKAALAVYTQMNGAYEHARSNRLLARRMEGPLRTPDVMEQTMEVLRLRRHMKNARREHQKTVAALEAVKWEDARAARLTGPNAAAAVKIAEEIVKLDAEIEVEGAALESRRQLQSVAKREYNELRTAYVARMLALGQPVPYTVEQFRIGELFDQGYPELLRAMNSNPKLVQALQQTLKEWEEYLREIRREN